MKTLVESVIKFNGRILYGADSFGNKHDQDLLVKSKNGYSQSGQVAVIIDHGTISDTKVCKNRAEAFKYIEETVPSQGIMA